MNASDAAQEICFEQRFRGSRGIFFGDNPFSSHTPLLLAQLSLCALLTTLLHRCLAPLGQSIFVSQILAGVILGPSVLGENVKFRDSLFPISSFYTIDTFAFFGVMFFFFIIGVKTDLSLLRISGKKAVAIGICTFSLPLLLNMTFGKFITRITHLEHSLHVSIVWIGSFQAISSFHVIICLLADLKLMNSEIGRVAISSSMVSGICSLIWTTVVFTAKQSSRSKKRTLLLMLLFLAIMVIFAVCVFRPLVLWMTRHNTSNNPNSVKESHLCAIFIFVLISALYGEYFGQHFIFGPILLGTVIPDGPPLGSALVNRLEVFITDIILPIFFVVSATRIDLSIISWRNLFIIEVMAFSAFFWKVVGAMLPSLWSKMPISDAFHLGLILSNQGIMEVLILERANAIDLIDDQSFTIMILSIFMFTAILAPVVKFSCKPYKRYMTGQRMNIQYAIPNSELRMLACLHYQEHTPSILNIFEASYPHPQSPICFYVIHLIELAGRSASLLISHQNSQRAPSIPNQSEHMINALRFFEHENQGHTTIYPFTSISPYSSMHVDVCSLAAEKRVSLVILLFHKHPVIVASEKEAKAIRTVNQNIIEECPCSVAILVDRGASPCTAARFSPSELYRVGVVFLGGPHDREALSYARMMAKHPNVCLTLIRFADEKAGNGNGYSRDSEMDFYALNDYREAQMENKQCFYQEEVVRDSMGIVSAIRSLDGCFDLILVGGRHDDDSPLLAGLHDWNEFPELGIVGDMLISMDSHEKASVLVVQQASSGSENFDNPYFDVGKDSWSDINNNRIWYPQREGLKQSSFV